VSFIRPDLARRLVRWREALVWTAVAAAGAALVLRGLVPPAPLLLLPGALALVAGIGLLLAALRRMAFASEPAAEGMVEIDEGRIGYFAPLHGGFVDIAALNRVELVRSAGGGGRAWRLTAGDGTRLTVPLGAAGAERLPDALSALLPGLDLSAAAALAREERHPATLLVWSRPASRVLLREP
jgi:hypothetical protein